MKVEIHILQNYPPSNLNRDESGSPKECDFGGRRQRISSQCIKRSVRQSKNFQSALQGSIGIRTKKVPQVIAKKLEGLGYEDKLAHAIASALPEALYGLSEKGETAYLLFIGAEEIDRMVALLTEDAEQTCQKAIELDELKQKRREIKKDKEKKSEVEELDKAIAIGQVYFMDMAKKYKKAYPGNVKAVDVALFGRMLADSPIENVDSACQIGHAIAVNPMDLGFDYFTAIDDLQGNQSSGAAMLGTIPFASSCFYKYACVDTEKLSANLAGNKSASREGTLAFVDAFIHARPAGKQNSFAAHTLPSMVMIVVRSQGEPVSMISAFEEPVYADRNSSITNKASKKLSDHYSVMKKMFGLKGDAFFISTSDSQITESMEQSGARRIGTVAELIENLDKTLS